jgi:hypothetical protein
MRATPTTWVTIYRGQQESPFGDVEDALTPVATHLPVSLLETLVRVLDPSSGRPQQVTIYMGRISPTLFRPQVDDRLRDERTGHLYAISSVQLPPGPVHTNDVRLELHRVT